MSDFLTNLAERNLNPVMAVRPRAGLPFEDAGRLGAARAFRSDQPQPSIAGWARPLDQDFEPDQLMVEEALVEVSARDPVERKPLRAGERIESADRNAIRAPVGETTIEASTRSGAEKSISTNFTNEVSAVRRTERLQEQGRVHLREFEITTEAPVFGHQRSPSSARLPLEQSKEEASFTAAPRAVIDQSSQPDGSVNPGLRPQASIIRHSESPFDWFRRIFGKSTRNGFGTENSRGTPPETGHQSGHLRQPEDRSHPVELDFVEKKQAPGQSRSLAAGDSESVNGFVLRPAWTVKPVITRRDFARVEASAALNGSQTSGITQHEPVIQVTIGRIEVRATEPSAQAKNEGGRTAPPVMSLDDYLRQRSRMGSTGGGR
ncbi:MAG: hypothetical protein ACREBD_19600 [Blastocatellia bacterium]